MKILCLSFTHDYWQETYKSTSVEKGWNELHKIEEELQAHIFNSVVDCAGTYYQYTTDDVVTVTHNFELTQEQKQRIADALEKICTIKSTYDKKNPGHEILVIFDKKDESDCFVYNVKR